MADEKNSVLRQKIADFEKDLADLDKKYSLDRTILMEFPQFNMYPQELQLALLIVKKYEPQFVFRYKEANAVN